MTNSPTKAQKTYAREAALAQAVGDALTEAAEKATTDGDALRERRDPKRLTPAEVLEREDELRERGVKLTPAQRLAGGLDRAWQGL